jgi:hypothetical protein
VFAAAEHDGESADMIEPMPSPGARPCGRCALFVNYGPVWSMELWMTLGEGRISMASGRQRGLRRVLVWRIIATGLVAIAGSVLLLGVQIQASADRQSATDVQRRAHLAAANLSDLFNRWHDELLEASSDGALTGWYTNPQARPALRHQINTMMIQLHTINPALIDEACFIDASGLELARQTGGVAAETADLSPTRRTTRSSTRRSQSTADACTRAAPTCRPTATAGSSPTRRRSL